MSDPVRTLLANVCPYPADQTQHGRHTRFLSLLAGSCRIQAHYAIGTQFLTCIELESTLIESRIHIDVRIKKLFCGQRVIVIVNNSGASGWRRIEIVVPETESRRIDY